MPEIKRIRDYWSTVKPALEDIIQAARIDELLPEDVYAACESGRAFYVHAPEGFVITMVDEDPVTNARELFIWFAWAHEFGGDCVARYSEYFIELAKQLECRYISTKTVFAPVGAHLAERGWKTGPTEYKLAVS